MKRILSLIVCAALCAALACFPVSASRVSAEDAVAALETLGLIRGDGNGDFGAGRGLTRAEAAVMLLRLLGREGAALEANYACPFEDAGWAAPYLAYGYARGYLRGVSDSLYAGDASVSARDYVTMMLRVLGYRDEADFLWENSLAFADSIHLTNGEYSAAPDRAFLREDMALLSYSALTMPQKDSGRTLLVRLCLDGAVQISDVRKTGLSALLDNLGAEYSAAEIYAMGSSAVFLTEAYDNTETLDDDHNVGSGSGFFISSDGLAVICYHQVDAAAAIRVTTTDGRVYPVERVLHYDPLTDLAVIRVGRTDTKGVTARYFPSLALGNSDAVVTGERIFTISNPLGLADCISDGLVSNRYRVEHDPAYPRIQFSAPVAQGSSGGPVLNIRGEVIGIVASGYTHGQNMSLAVPVNALREIDLSAEGVTVEEMLRDMDEKKAAATITASESSLTLREGESCEVLISTDFPGQPALRLHSNDIDVVDGVWLDYQTKQSILLKVVAAEAGEAAITVSFADYDGSDGSDAVIQVNVVK
ncbi:MAG: trypsin-like peptidase domain-containing protein [Oscillospiraceae bacterium]|nr:trypsin-like peptidase domain-containing protein [Oscillospiraceae bacterium]